MSFVVDSFNDTNKWMEVIAGTGTIPEKTADTVKLSVAAADDIAGLVTINPQNLTTCDIRIYADRRAARTALIIRPNQVFANLFTIPENYLYTLIRDRAYGVQVFDGHGYHLNTADTVSPSEPAELRMVISGGKISFYYNGELLTLKDGNTSITFPSGFSPSSLYVYVAAYATFNGSETGTSTFSAMPTALTIRIEPSTPQTILKDGSVIFTAIPGGGTSPYNVGWYVNGGLVGTGLTMQFIGDQEGTFEVYAVVTDYLGNTATSPTTAVTVLPPPPISIVVTPPSAIIYVGEEETFTTVASYGSPPYSYGWINNLTGTVIGTGATFVFSASIEGHYEIYAKVTDALGATATSAIVVITVTSTPQPRAEETPSEIRAVLVGSASITETINWPLVAQTIKDAGAEILVISAGELSYSRYPSVYIPSHSGRDHVGEALAAAHAAGLKFYVKFNECNGPPGSEYRVMVCNKDTGVLESYGWVCPTKQVSRQILRNVAEELVTRYPEMDGFQFDYIRYELREMCYCNECKAKFIVDHPECADVDWPRDVAIIARVAGRYFETFINWRPTTVNELVKEMRNAMIAKKPDIEFSAAVFVPASAIVSGDWGFPGYWRYWIGQDAAFWIKEGWLDWVAPMAYTTSIDKLAGYMRTFMHFFVGDLNGVIPVGFYLANCYPATVAPADFKLQIDKGRELGTNGWNIWRFGGPGDGSTTAPDIRDYLSILNLPEIFSLYNVKVQALDNQVVVTWETDKPTKSRLEYSASPLFTAAYKLDTRTIGWTNERHYYWEIAHQPGVLIEDLTPKTIHSVTLMGLLPGRYYMRVQSEDESGIASSKMFAVVVGEITEFWSATITSDPSVGGSTSPSGTAQVPVGQDLEVAAIPQSGYLFDHWESSIAEINGSTANPVVIPAQELGTAHTLVAFFTRSPLRGCFIATAAYGSPLAPQLSMLRWFRDFCLPIKIAQAYYRLSPPIARFIGGHGRVRVATRILLKPIIVVVERIRGA